jgi:hypothetical protein
MPRDLVAIQNESVSRMISYKKTQMTHVNAEPGAEEFDLEWTSLPSLAVWYG